MKNKYLLVVILAIFGILIALFAVAPKYTPPAEEETVASKNLEGFAQCLTDQGVTMYGAVWCPHCQKQKKEFGDSFKLVSYVECPENPKLCIAKDIKGYPTWIFKDGSRLEGEQSLETLSRRSSCPLPGNEESTK